MPYNDEGNEQYLYARRKALKTAFHRRLHKKDPFLVALDEIVNTDACSAVHLGQIDVPSKLIVGTKTVGRKSSFAADFMPLLKDGSEFGRKWINVCRYHLSETGISEAPTAYEYLGKFYIEEGNKRVSVLKSYGAPYITLDVTRLMVEKSEAKEVLLYYEFLDFYKLTSLYSIQFTKPGYYKKLLRYMGYSEDYVWQRNDRITMIGFYERLSHALDKKGIHANHADCLVALLELYTYDFLVEISDKQLDRVISENRTRLSYGKGFYSLTCIADEEDPLLYSSSVIRLLKDCDFIISAGDLNPKYLEYIVTLTNKPLFYIHGNHDSIMETRPPEGCICIDDDLIIYQGIRILGLGGSYRYSNETYQYTEVQMERRIRKLRFKIAKAKGVDIVVTHAPIKGYGDLNDYAHQGFECFNKLLEELKPRFWFYGHVHKSYDPLGKRIYAHKNTMIINVCGSYKAKY